MLVSCVVWWSSCLQCRTAGVEVKKACEFLLCHQMEDGGWGEDFAVSLTCSPNGAAWSLNECRANVVSNLTKLPCIYTLFYQPEKTIHHPHTFNSAYSLFTFFWKQSLLNFVTCHCSHVKKGGMSKTSNPKWWTHAGLYWGLWQSGKGDLLQGVTITLEVLGYLKVDLTWVLIPRIGIQILNPLQGE